MHASNTVMNRELFNLEVSAMEEKTKIENKKVHRKVSQPARVSCSKETRKIE
jgi:hypothetical protein